MQEVTCSIVGQDDLLPPNSHLLPFTSQAIPVPPRCLSDLPTPHDLRCVPEEGKGGKRVDGKWCGRDLFRSMIRRTPKGWDASF